MLGARGALGRWREYPLLWSVPRPTGLINQWATGGSPTFCHLGADQIAKSLPLFACFYMQPSRFDRCLSDPQQKEKCEAVAGVGLLVAEEQFDDPDPLHSAAV